MPTPSADVFVSYSSLDRPAVGRVVAALAARGVRVWWDRAGLRGGHGWNGEIEKAIAGSRVVLVACSPHLIRSDNARVEVEYAWDAGPRRYIPVWVSAPVPFPPGTGYGTRLGHLHRIETLGRAEAVWLPELLAALAEHGVPAGAAGLVPAPPADPPPRQRMAVPLGLAGVAVVAAAAVVFALTRPPGQPAGPGDGAAAIRPAAEPAKPAPADPAPAPKGPDPAEGKKDAPPSNAKGGADPPPKPPGPEPGGPKPPPKADLSPEDAAVAGTVWVRWDADPRGRRAGVLLTHGTHSVVLTPRRPGPAPPDPNQLIFPVPDPKGGFRRAIQPYEETPGGLAKDGYIQAVEGGGVARPPTGPLALFTVVRVPDLLPAGVRPLLFADNRVAKAARVWSCGMSEEPRGAGWATADGRVANTPLFTFTSPGGVRVEGRKVEHDAAAGAEDAGGPLVNDLGELVGVHVPFYDGNNRVARVVTMEATDIKSALEALPLR